MDIEIEYHGIVFEFDSEKAELVEKKHNITFDDEVMSVFLDELAIAHRDNRDYDGEDRFRIIGISNKYRVLVVAWVQIEDKIRLITAFKADKEQTRRYNNATRRIN